MPSRYGLRELVMWELGIIIVKSLLIIISVLLSVAFLTVAERKWMSSIQRRRGPNIVGFYGLLQAIADGVKLIVKEVIKPWSADSVIFMVAPIISFGINVGCWSVMPVSEGVVLGDINVGVLYVLSISSLGVYGVILAGYSSNSKYGFYGSIRSSAQMISYEVSIGFIISIIAIRSNNTLNISEIVLNQSNSWNVWGLLPVFIMFVISVIAETNRLPFDLPEAEAELVSGYNVEYSAGSFALFFLGEYSSMILVSSLSVCLFWGGWCNSISSSLNIMLFSLKTVIVVSVFIWARAALPRYRYDQLLEIGWKVMLPLSLGWLIWEIGVYVVWG